MDKKKSGKLIKEARIQKNYTQSELGDLLGVSNKAVSRWETGESFPDVGILENLASLLEIRIQDIVTGERERSDDSVVTEIVRVATLQQREKKRKLITSILLIIVLISCIISGCSAMGNKGYLLVNDSIISYIILMAISYFAILVVAISEDNVSNYKNNKYEKSMKIVALVSLILTLIIGFEEFFIISVDQIPFGLEKTKVGPFILGQLIVVFIVNMIMCIIATYMYEKRNSSIHFGWLLSVTSIYLLVLYGDLLYRINDSSSGMFESLILRSFVVIIVLGVSLILAWILGKRRGER